MSPRWGFKTFGYPACYTHVAPLGIKNSAPIHYTHCAPLEREQSTYRYYRHTAPLEHAINMSPRWG